jgi:hypothetical protein
MIMRAELAHDLKLRAEYELIFANLRELTSSFNNHLISEGGDFFVAGGSIISIIFGSKVTDIDIFYCGAGKDDGTDANFISEMTEMMRKKIKQQHELIVNDTSIVRTEKSITLKTTSPMWLAIGEAAKMRRNSSLSFRFNSF